jgi:hypothetical protein
VLRDDRRAALVGGDFDVIATCCSPPAGGDRYGEAGLHHQRNPLEAAERVQLRVPVAVPRGS